MDPITTAIVAALAAGAMGSLTDASKTAITDGYNKLKDLLIKRCGASSDIVQAVNQLEAKPESVNRKGVLHQFAEILRSNKWHSRKCCYGYTG